jgi:hypothetical protein
MRWQGWVRTAICVVAFLPVAAVADDFDYAGAITRIADGIAGLKPAHPKLQDFSPAANLRANQETIWYQFHTHDPPKTGGWTSGVPNPDDDGIWFFIDFHDPNSRAEVHTQPVTGPPMCIGAKHVSFLILQGKATPSVYGPIWTVLRAQGVKECPR